MHRKSLSATESILIKTFIKENKKNIKKVYLDILSSSAFLGVFYITLIFGLLIFSIVLKGSLTIFSGFQLLILLGLFFIALTSILLLIINKFEIKSKIRDDLYTKFYNYILNKDTTLKGGLHAKQDEESLPFTFCGEHQETNYIGIYENIIRIDGLLYNTIKFNIIEKGNISLSLFKNSTAQGSSVSTQEVTLIDKLGGRTRIEKKGYLFISFIISSLIIAGLSYIFGHFINSLTFFILFSIAFSTSLIFHLFLGFLGHKNFIASNQEYPHELTKVFKFYTNDENYALKILYKPFINDFLNWKKIYNINVRLTITPNEVYINYFVPYAHFSIRPTDYFFGKFQIFSKYYFEIKKINKLILILTKHFK